MRSRSQRLELIFGMLAGVVGLAFLGLDVLGQQVGLGSLAIDIAVFGGLSLGIALFALWHSLSLSLPALILLWVWTVPLCGVAFLVLIASAFGNAGPAWGLVILAALLAFAASMAGTVAALVRSIVPRAHK